MRDPKLAHILVYFYVFIKKNIFGATYSLM